MADSSSLTQVEADFPTVVNFLKSVVPLVPAPTTEEETCVTSNTIDRVTLGNPAGDADSLVSAIACAYLDTILQSKPTLPILSIPFADLQTQRPETKYLMQLAGIFNNSDVEHDAELLLVAKDDVHSRVPDQASVTLVDHNQLTWTKQLGWSVDTIYDHHLDEESHIDTCPKDSAQRQVAFDATSSAALVASTCTLMVERWQSETSALQAMPASLAILLLGVILLDSVNMLPQAGKVTQRDRKAVKFLQEVTVWEPSDLPAEIQSTSTPPKPDTDKLFEKLQGQKFAPEFWNGLTASQALKLDYKAFSIPNSSDQRFGIASILQSLSDFQTKPGIWKSVVAEFPDLEFFGLMFLSVEDEHPKRQLALCSTKKELLKDLVSFLETDTTILKANVIEEFLDESTQLYIVTMEQANPKGSRKQVAPILMEFFQQKQDSKL